MTLRKLDWMAAEKRRVMGLLAAWHLASLVPFIPFTGGGVRLDPAEINPFRPREPENPAVERIKAFIRKRQWVALAKGARGGN